MRFLIAAFLVVFAVLGLGAAVAVFAAVRAWVPSERPAVKNGQIVIRKMMNLSSSFDHRVVDGAIGAEFLAAFKKLIEDPLTMLL